MSEHEQERSSIGALGYASHNARVIQIKRFCMCPPKGPAAFLRLAVAGETGEVLCQYEKEECVKDNGDTIPDVISMCLEEHVQAVRIEVQAILAWCREDGSQIVTKRLRARPPNQNHGMLETPGMSPQESAALVGYGDDRAYVAQVIRSNEINMRSNLQGHHITLQDQRELCQVAIEQAKMSGAMATEMYAKMMASIENHASLLAENYRMKAELEAKDLKIAALTLLLEGEAPEEEDAPEVVGAKREMIEQATAIMSENLPDVLKLGKLWAMSQIGKNNAAAAAAAKAAAAANGAVNGHTVVE